MKNIYKIQSFTLPIALSVQVGKPLCSVGIIKMEYIDPFEAKKDKQIYISGKISGLLYADAYENFARAEMYMQKELGKDFEIINPMNIAHNHDKSWENYMRVDLKALLDCTHIYMLNDWRDSRGAVIEYNLAKELGLIILFETNN